MDIATLTHEITTHLVPYLPALYAVTQTGAAEAGKGLAGEIGKAVGGSLSEKVQAVWQKLWFRLASKPAALEAVKDAAAAPHDEDTQAALRVQLKKLLTEDAVFADEISQQWEQAKVAGEITVTQSGHRNVNVMGNVTGNITTGDGKG